MAPSPSQSPKAYSYLRFSSPEQAKGASRRRQIEAAERWARENGMALDERLRDEGVSAFKGRHRAPTSALGGFLKRVEAGEVAKGSFLIIESFDRLSREEVVDALELFLTITRAGITVVTLADNRVYNRESLRRDQTQLIVSIIIMARAYEESATKSKRVGHAWSSKREAARASGQAMTATCPGWMRLVGGPRTGRYELIPERADLVRSIFAATIAGEGRRTIVKRLNADGVEPWGEGGNKGRHWHDSYVQKILTSTAAFGRYDMRGEAVEGYFPPVVSEGTYWQARAATARRRFGAGRPTGRFANLLHGLARCHICGSNMAYLDKGRRSAPVLRCTKAMAKAGCESAVRANYKLLEDLTVGLYARFKDAATFAERQVAGRAAAELEPLESRLAAARARGDNLAAAIAEGGELAPLRRLLDAAELEAAGLEARLADLRIAAAAQGMAYTDPGDREAEILFHLNDGDDAQRFQRRRLFNSRLRQLLTALVVDEGGQGYEIHTRHGIDPWDPEVAEPECTLTEADIAAADAIGVDEVLRRAGID